MLPTMLAPEAVAPNTERPTHSRQTSAFLLAAFFLHLLFILQLIPANLHAITTSNSTTAFSSSLADVHQRPKRQWSSPYQQQFPPQMQMCPPQCFACSPMHCQAYQCIQPQVANMVRCCCRPVMIVHPQPDLKSACDGEEAVAACLNGLCGQGYFCNVNKFCCRCQTGKSLGRCVNNLCPVGYACNSNDYCCAIGAGSVLGPCINGRCPEGYECGAGELCYARSGNSWAGASTQKPPINGNNVRRNYPPVRRSRPRWTYSLESGAARRGENKRRRQKQRHTWTDYDNDNKWQKGKRVMDFDDYEL